MVAGQGDGPNVVEDGGKPPYTSFVQIMALLENMDGLLPL
jgi:hypothetical protein